MVNQSIVAVKFCAVSKIYNGSVLHGASQFIHKPSIDWSLPGMIKSSLLAGRDIYYLQPIFILVAEVIF